MASPEQKLQEFRARIDAVDDQLIRLFIERIGIIREVAALKGEHWPKPCHIRPGREGEMHQALARRFTGTGFPPLMALAIWRQLIGGSTHVESPLNITYFADHPEHRYFAREYFGVQAGTTAAASLAEALRTLDEGSSNILVLPTPPHGDWWRDTAALQRAGLFIFATLPVAAGNAPSGTMPAVALAALTPEDSGNDISYFVEADGTLVTEPRFVTEREGAAYLGSHPRAISLTEGVLYA